jgi:hypothetical protein
VRARRKQQYIIGALTATTTALAAAVATPALAEPAKAGGPAGALDTTVIKTFQTSAGGGTKATVSSHGNIVDYLSPNSAGAGRYEHMGVGAIGEGYVLCYTGPTGTVNTFDTGASEAGFGPSTVVSQSATKITIARNTADGRLRLTNAITFVGAARAVQVQMSVKNNTGSPIPNVVLRRQVDFDVDAGGTDGWSGFSNWHARTSQTSVFAWNDPDSAPADKEAHAMQLRFLATSPGVTRSTFVTNQILDSTCTADSRRAGAPAFGDYGDTAMVTMGTLPAGASKFMKVEYLRF